MKQGVLRKIKIGIAGAVTGASLALAICAIAHTSFIQAVNPATPPLHVGNSPYEFFTDAVPNAGESPYTTDIFRSINGAGFLQYQHFFGWGRTHNMQNGCNPCTVQWFGRLWALTGPQTGHAHDTGVLTYYTP